MKVVEFPPKAEDAKKPLLSEVVQEAIVAAGLEETDEGTFFMVVDTEEKTTFVTNEVKAAEIVYLIEQVKMTIMGAAE